MTLKNKKVFAKVTLTLLLGLSGGFVIYDTTVKHLWKDILIELGITLGGIGIVCLIMWCVYVIFMANDSGAKSK